MKHKQFIIKQKFLNITKNKISEKIYNNQSILCDLV